MCEIWRDVVGYDGRYKVSSKGRVKSIERTVERSDGFFNVVPSKMFALTKDNMGYYTVRLTKNGICKSKLVHKLVAEAFIDNPMGYKYVNHIDENKTNNKVDNLEWCSHEYNIGYTCNIPVLGIDNATGKYKFYKSITGTVKDGFTLQNVAKVCKQEYGRKSCKGWTFYYLDGKFIIGIDESYSRLGMSLMYDNKVVETVSIDYKGCTNNSQKRKEVSKELSDLIKRWRLDRRDATIIVERIRLRSQGFLSESYMKSTGALVATIIDTAYKMNIPVYSVDTRSWKSQIVGTSKPKENKYGIDPHKWPTILYLKQKGLLKHIAYPYKGKSTKGVIKVNMGLTEGAVNCKINDDVADSICIAMYGFLPKSKQKLKEEKF